MATETATPNAAVTFNAMGKKNANGYVQEIALNDVTVIEGFNPRASENEAEIDVLAKSIAKQGLIHPPTVRPTAVKGKFELISGHRRFKALKTLGRESAVFTVRLDIADDMDAKAFAVAENSEDGRTNLTYVELGKSFMEMSGKGWGKDLIATKSGVHPATVSRAMKVMELPKEIIELVQKRVLSESAALVYAKLDPAVQNQIDQEKLVGASAHFIKVLAAEAQKKIAAAGGEATGEAANAGGKKKGKVKINWRSPKERTDVIRQLAHIAFNPKNEGAAEAYTNLKVLYWMRGHGKALGDLSKTEMLAFIKEDNDAHTKAAQYVAEKEAKQREAEAKAKEKAKGGKK